MKTKLTIAGVTTRTAQEIIVEVPTDRAVLDRLERSDAIYRNARLAARTAANRNWVE